MRYIDNGERRYRESRTAPILGIEKKTEPKGSEMTFAPQGRNSTSKHGEVWAQIATTHTSQGLAEGAAPTTPNWEK